MLGQPSRTPRPVGSGTTPVSQRRTARLARVAVGPAAARRVSSARRLDDPARGAGDRRAVHSPGGLPELVEEERDGRSRDGFAGGCGS